MNPLPHKKITDYSEADRSWAAHKMADLLVNCILNTKLKQTGMVSKFLFEMTDDETIEYYTFVVDLCKKVKQ